MARRYDAAWGDAERAEHEALIAEVMQQHEGNAHRADAYRAGIADAIQAHRPWARDVMDKALESGFLNRWKQVSREGVVLVVRDGRSFQKPRTWAVKRTDDEGNQYTQDALIDVLTREDVAERRRAALKLSTTYSNEARMWSAVLDFLDAASADDTETAGAVLGVSLDEWLEGRDAA